MSAYSWGIEISRIFCNKMGKSFSIYRLGHHNLRDNTNYWLFILEIKEHYTILQSVVLVLKISWHHPWWFVPPLVIFSNTCQWISAILQVMHWGPYLVSGKSMCMHCKMVLFHSTSVNHLLIWLWYASHKSATYIKVLNVVLFEWLNNTIL